MDDGRWACGACTFVNQALFLCCDMCGGKRPFVGALEATNESMPMVDEPEEEVVHSRTRKLKKNKHLLKARTVEATQQPATPPTNSRIVSQGGDYSLRRRQCLRCVAKHKLKRMTEGRIVKIRLQRSILLSK